MNRSRKEWLEEIDEKIKVPFNNLSELNSLAEEMGSIGESGKSVPFDYEELNKISLISIALTARTLEFVNTVANCNFSKKDKTPKTSLALKKISN